MTLELKLSAVEKAYKLAPGFVKPYLLPLLELVRELVAEVQNLKGESNGK